MRITASLVARPRGASALAAALGAAALIFTALAVWLTASIFEMQAEQPRLEARLLRLDEQLAGAGSRATLPPTAELESLRRRVKALNALSGVHGWDTARLLAWFERQTPNDVHLVSLHHKVREGETLLTAESPSAAALTEFLRRLEREPRFAEVLLSKQGSRGAPGATAVQFDLRVRLKP